MFTECYLPTTNGVVVSVNTFAEGLQRLGVTVQIIAPRCAGYTDVGDGVCRLPSVVTPWRSDYPLIIPGRHRIAFRRCEGETDIVHVHSPFIAGNLGRRVARRLRLPLVFTFHTIYEEYVHYVPVPRFLARYVAKRVSRRFAESCDAVVAPSEGIRQLLRRDGVTTRIEVIPTGLDLDLVAPERLLPMRERFGVEAQAPLLAYVGRVAKEKSIDIMLDAFALVVKQIPDCVLLVVGDGNWLEPAKARSSELRLQQSVRFAGCLPRQEALSCSAEADALLFPSITDTQGIVVLEAMAVGTPCIAVRSGAVAGLVEDAVNGVVVEHAAAEMAQAAMALLGDRERRERLSAAARQTAQGFSADAMSRRLLGLYESLVAPRRSGPATRPA